MKKLLYIVSVLGTSIFVQAQEKKWDLTQCIEYALENNLSIQKENLQQQSVQWDKTASFGAFLPSINASANGSYNFGRTINPVTNEFIDQNSKSTSFGISSSVNLYNGGRRRLQYENSKLAIEQQSFNVEQLKRDVSMNIALAYLQVLFQQENLEIAIKRKALSKSQLERVKIQVKNGQLAMSKQLDLEAQFYVEDQNELTAIYNLKNAQMNLFQLLDIRDYESQNISIPLAIEVAEKKTSYTIAEIFDAAKRVLPKYQNLQKQKEIAVNNTKVSKSSGLPTVSLGGNLNSLASDRAILQSKTGDFFTPVIGQDVNGNPITSLPQPIYEQKDMPFKDQVKQNYSKSISLSLNIPIFNGLQTRVNTEKARVNELTLDISARELENQIYKDVQNAIIDAEKAQDAYFASKKSLISAQDAFNNAQSRYKLSAISVYDLQQVKNTLFQAKSKLVQAKYDYVFKNMVIKFYQGKAITL